MAKILIAGAGFAGHFAAMTLNLLIKPIFIKSPLKFSGLLTFSLIS